MPNHILKSAGFSALMTCVVVFFMVHPELCASFENADYTPNPEVRAIYLKRGVPLDLVLPIRPGVECAANTGKIMLDDEGPQPLPATSDRL
jgi:hypothetical protein